LSFPQIGRFEINVLLPNNSPLIVGSPLKVYFSNFNCTA